MIFNPSLLNCFIEIFQWLAIYFACAVRQVRLLFSVPKFYLWIWNFESGFMKFSMHQELSNYALILPFDVKHEFCFAICMFSYVSNNFENWTKLLTFSWSKAFSSVLLGSLSKEVFTVFSLLWKHDDKSYLWPTINFVWCEQNVCQITILTFFLYFLLLWHFYLSYPIFTYPIFCSFICGSRDRLGNMFELIWTSFYNHPIACSFSYCFFSFFGWHKFCRLKIKMTRLKRITVFTHFSSNGC